MGVPVVAQWIVNERIQLVSMRIWVLFLTLLRGLRIQHCGELWCGWQMQLGPRVAVAVCRLVAAVLI